MNTFNFSGCFLRASTVSWPRRGVRLGPCGHCHEVHEAIEGRGDAYSLLLPDGRKTAFCSARCIVDSFTEDSDQPVSWGIEELAPTLRSDWWGKCMGCGQKDEEKRFIAIVAPYESELDFDDGPFFCSAACVVHTFRQEIERVEGSGLGKWFRSVGLPIPIGPCEAPRAAAHLKRLRRKLRPGELARLDE